MSRMIVNLAAAALLALVPGATLAQSDQPVGTVEYTGGSVALGIGYSWGSGLLHFQNQVYPFTVNGLSVVNVGASSVKATGEVYNLTKAEDFPGNYVAATAGVTVAGGGSGSVMRNQNGVVIKMGTTTQGLQFTLAPSGISVAFAGAPTPGPAPAGSTTPPQQ